MMLPTSNPTTSIDPVSPVVVVTPQKSSTAEVDTTPVAGRCDPSAAPLDSVTPLDRVPPPDRSCVWNVPFDRVTMDGAIDRIESLIERRTPSYAITANLNYAMLHNRSPQIQQITEHADLILADGQPIVWRSRWSDRPLPQRVAGSEMIHHLARRASEKGWRVFFLGGRPSVARRCSQRLAELYPGLKIAGVESPPFRALTEEEQADQVQRIHDSEATVLLVAFGQPKGEQWIAQNYRKLGVPLSIQLGASFDFVAGTAHRAPQVWQRLGAEWAYRMLSDPRRLVPRYAANAWFLLTALADDFRRMVTQRQRPSHSGVADSSP
jgi:N-acetylglucosaminyldiphosphoundecaprenol N-acetyl-beta-D-mannosaminyltransferase